MSVGGPCDVTVISELAHAVDVRARDPTVGDVAHDRHVEASKWPFFSRIVRRSRSACVGCSWAPSPAFTMEQAAGGQELGGPGRRVADHDHVGAHRGDVLPVSRSSRPCSCRQLARSDDVRREPFTAISNEVRVRVDDS